MQRKMLLSIVVAVLIATTVPSARAQVRFTGWEVWNASLRSLFVDSADFNGDGIADLLTSGNSNGFEVHRGDGGGHFELAGGAGIGSSLCFARAGDVTGDGKIDVVLARFNGFDLYVGDANFGFAAPVWHPLASTAYSIAVDDFDEDGRADVAAATDSAVEILLSNGSSLSLTQSVAVGVSPSWIRAVDLDLDGHVDLVMAQRSDTQEGIATLFGDGNGSFVRQTGHPLAGAAPATVAVADFNTDGLLDIAVADSVSFGVGVTVLYGLGARAFGNAQVFPAGISLVDIEAGDFNHDGHVDWIVGRGNEVILWAGDGAGFFTHDTTWPTLAQAWELRAVDVNGDQVDDLAFGQNIGAANLGVMIADPQATFEITPALIPVPDPADTLAVDLNADGNVDLATSLYNSSSIEIRLGDGAGNFPIHQTFSVSTQPTLVRALNFDGGAVDLAVLTRNGVDLLSGTGNGNFVFIGTLPTQVAAPDLHIADVNGDAKPDIIVANGSAGDVLVYLGVGGGFGPAASFPVGFTADAVASGRFDSNASVDLVVASKNAGAIFVLRGDGAGGFVLDAMSYPSQHSPSSIAVGDLDDDGELDLAVGSDSASSIGVVRVFFGDGAARFLDTEDFQTNRSPRDVVIGQFDDAGSPLDIAAAVEGDWTITVFRGTGGGSFARQSFDANVAPFRLSAATVDNDPYVDLVVAGLGGDRVTIRYNRTFGEPAVDACMRGTVNSGAGLVADTLYVNGSTGGTHRTVHVDAGDFLWTTMLSAPQPGNGRFLVHANFGRPTFATTRPLPANVGRACFDFLLTRGANPAAIWNGIGNTPLVGSSRDFDGNPIPDPGPAPELFYAAPNGDPGNLPPGTFVTLQGVLIDLGSQSPKRASTTNSVVLHIE